LVLGAILLVILFGLVRRFGQELVGVGAALVSLIFSCLRDVDCAGFLFLLCSTSFTKLEDQRFKGADPEPGGVASGDSRYRGVRV